MKVTLDTPGKLVISHVPWLIGIALIVFILAILGAGFLLAGDSLLFGLMFALIGGGMAFIAFVAFVQRRQAVFDSSTGNVTLRKKTLFSETGKSHRLSYLLRAEVETLETRHHKERTIPTHRAVLIFNEGRADIPRPITDVFTNGKGAEHTVAAINDWLKARHPHPPRT